MKGLYAMNHPEASKDLSNQILAALYYRAFYIEGWEAALGFSLVYESLTEGGEMKLKIHLQSEDQLKTEIQGVESGLSLDQLKTGILSKRSEVYKEGYLAGLKYALARTTAGELAPTSLPGGGVHTHPERVLQHQRTFSGGQVAALLFAIKCKGNTPALENEIQETTELVAENRGSTAPGAGPRVYKEGYLEGLKEAIDIVKRVTQGENLPSAVAGE
jgi:hypothetical protein